MVKISSSNLGYPRIGENREWKKTLESFWSKNITEEAFHEQMKKYRLHYLQQQAAKDINYIPVGDFSLYDHVLDTATMFGLVPPRFDYTGGEVSLSTYFAMARGNQSAHACEMTKWFDTNYHYIVPELLDPKPVLVDNKPLKAFIEARDELDIIGKPVILGPFTLLKLSKGFNDKDFGSLLNRFIPVYIELLQQLEAAGANIVQIDEPALVMDITEHEMDMFSHAYEKITSQLPNVDIILQTYFEAVTHYQKLIKIPVKGFGLDFVNGVEENIASIRTYGFPKDKILCAGIIDGRNVWKSDLENKFNLITSVNEVVGSDHLIIQPSSSLLHVPVSLENETKIPAVVKDALAFCHEKLDELKLIRDAVSDPSTSNMNSLKIHDQSYKELLHSDWRKQTEVSSIPTFRQKNFSERNKLHQEQWNLPLFPTTTIGSFPQSKKIRQLRAKWKKGELENDTYESEIKKEIKRWIHIQEKLDLDVFVHGEFERNDMVEFFGQKLAGFTFSQYGWVQSYGSRCVKPPIIYGNVSFIEPMTLKETLYAQSLTNKPVKGMLTGPVTILNWSFVRNDISNKEVAFQIAEALLKEVKLLEEAGITMIQVDEPALREGLPLKRIKHKEYLNWAVEAFRTSTSDISDSTQIHTHMCYSEFDEIINSIRDLDADVISIETSRSHGEIISTFEEYVYDKGIGLGVYDIHSPRIPTEEEIHLVIERALSVLPASLFWINPDCGLKTRTELEAVSALQHMVTAAKKIRNQVAIK